MKTAIRILSAQLIALTLSLGLVGCSDEPNVAAPTGDVKGLSDLMSEWNDAKVNLKGATKLFAKGAEPTAADFKKYAGFSYTLKMFSSVSGTTAILPVEIRSEKDEGEPKSVDWTFEKEGDAWKIKAAPMP